MMPTMRPAPISAGGRGFTRHGYGAKKPTRSKFNNVSWLKLYEFNPPIEHVPPDIKHNRIPAPEMGFTRPNLPVLIREIEELAKA